jgi:HK97 family phage prohead protease
MPIAKRIRKQTSGVRVTGDRVVEFVLSTGAVDRDYDSIDPAGWDLSDYSGVVLFGHDAHRPPVARGRAWVEGDRLLGEAVFPPEGTSPFADEVLALIQAGVLTDCSVGFAPTVPPTSNEFGGYRFPGAQLLEWSIVSIGSNRDARVLSRALAEPELAVLKAWTGRKTYEDRPQPAHPARPGGPVPGMAVFCVGCGAAMSDDSWRYCPNCGSARATGAAPPAPGDSTGKAWERYLAEERQKEATMWANVTSDDLKEVVTEAARLALPAIQHEVHLHLTGQLD